LIPGDGASHRADQRAGVGVPEAGPGGRGPVVVGDRVRYRDRLWRVVGIYVVHDPGMRRR